jgi:hypothetical protein
MTFFAQFERSEININSIWNEHMKTLSLLTIAAVMGAPTFAQDTRQAESHEHGVGQLDIAIEGTKVSMELHAPGADIVGFEYAPKSEADHNIIDAAVAKLSKPMDLIGLPTSAGCSVLEASAELEGEDEHSDHDDEHKDDEHADEHDDDHKDDEHTDEHADHEDEGEEENHTEFHAEYLFECGELNSATLTEITFPYFEAFPNAKELELQVISEKGATAFEVERDTPSVNLSGLF